MKKLDWNLLADLYVTFVKIGSFTLGGGYAMIPLIQREAVDNKKWCTEEEMTDFITLGQSVPGVVGINTATGVGQNVAGIPGAVSATLGMVTPSLIIIMIIASMFDEFQKWTLVQNAFSGVRAAVVALIFIAVLRLAGSAAATLFQRFIVIGAALCVLVLKIPPAYMILAGAIIGVTYNAIAVKISTNGGKGDA